jgi:hypothetical protein
MPVLTPDAAETKLYTCRACGAEDVPFERMTKSTKRGRMVVYRECLSCSNARKRRAEQERAAAPRSEDGTIIEPVTVSDPAPARLLADLLREDRDRWQFPFDSVASRPASGNRGGRSSTTPATPGRQLGATLPAPVPAPPPSWPTRRSSRRSITTRTRPDRTLALVARSPAIQAQLARPGHPTPAGNSSRRSRSSMPCSK